MRGTQVPSDPTVPSGPRIPSGPRALRGPFAVLRQPRTGPRYMQGPRHRIGQNSPQLEQPINNSNYDGYGCPLPTVTRGTDRSTRALFPREFQQTERVTVSAAPCLESQLVTLTLGDRVYKLEQAHQLPTQLGFFNPKAPNFAQWQVPILLCCEGPSEGPVEDLDLKPLAPGLRKESGWKIKISPRTTDVVLPRSMLEADLH
ncbi:hypothetical protein F5Y09DRAFT_178225 [Xylaria sp. FL1042]|nr:hypothetical protein F5Y09DRAFT_178225 [Xylaria sp. FL1042]